MYAQIYTSLLRFGASVNGQNPNNDAQNTSTYLKGIIQIAIYLGVSAPLLRICVYAPIIQRWKTLLSKITFRNFCACTQKSSTSLLRICVYGQKIQQMIIIQSSNNAIVDVLRPAQNLQIWNMYIHETPLIFPIPRAPAPFPKRGVRALFKVQNLKVYQ